MPVGANVNGLLLLQKGSVKGLSLSRQPHKTLFTVCIITYTFEKCNRFFENYLDWLKP